MVNKDRLIKNFIEMVEISSPSKEERKIADYIISQMKELDIEVYEDDCKDKIDSNAGNLIIKIPGNKKKTILFSAHMDTVTPCEKVVAVIEDNIIRSDKTTVLGADDKAGIAAIIEMIKVVKENNLDHPEVVVIFSVAEEAGLLGAINMDFSKLPKIDHGYILDAGGKPGVCYTQSPHSANGQFEIVGRAAHSGTEPENGINAFVVASEATTKLKIGRIDHETTCNIGMARGGTAPNIVMPSITLEFEARSLCEHKLDKVLKNAEQTFKDVCKRYDAKFTSTVKKGIPGFNISKDADTIKIFEASCKKMGLEFNAYPSGGGSDTNIYNMNEIPSVNIGVGMNNVHTTDEYIEIEELVNSARLLLSIIEEI